MLFFDKFFVNSKKNIRRATIDDLIQRKDNLVFLDFDGVINTEGRANKKCIRYLNRFCKKYHCHIVVSSSWKNYYEYKEFLYHSGLHKDIIIDGTTERLRNRTEEIKKYVFNFKTEKETKEFYEKLDQEIEKLNK